MAADMSLGNSQDFPISGTIDFISNQLDPNTGSLRVRAVFPNKDGFVGAGLFGRIRVPISATHDALLVIDRAVGTNQGQKYVLVVNANNEVEYRAVDVGQLHDGLREVLRYRAGHRTRERRQRRHQAGRSPQPDGPGHRRGVAASVRPGAKVDPRLVDMLTMLLEKPAAASPATERKPAEGAAPK